MVFCFHLSNIIYFKKKIKHCTFADVKITVTVDDEVVAYGTTFTSTFVMTKVTE